LRHQLLQLLQKAAAAVHKQVLGSPWSDSTFPGEQKLLTVQTLFATSLSTTGRRGKLRLYSALYDLRFFVIFI
jgi:hypothetical protein